MPVLSDAASRMRVLNIVVIVVVLSYIAVSVWGGWDAVTRAVARVGLIGIAAACCLTLLNTVLRFVRWTAYLSLFGVQVPTLTSLRIYVAGFALATTPGGAGEPLVRGVFLNAYRFGFDKTMAAYVAERISDVLAMLIITTIGLSAYPAGEPFLLIVAIAIAALILLVLRIDWLVVVFRASAKRTNFLARAVQHGLATLQHCRAFLTPRLMVSGVVLGILAWGANAASFWYLTYLVGNEISFALALFIYSFAVLFGGLSFLPGGVGTAEAAMIALCIFNGIPEGEAVAVTLVHRSVTLWFSVLLGVGCYHSQRRRALESSHAR